MACSNGESEEILGELLRRRREELILAANFHLQMGAPGQTVPPR